MATCQGEAQSTRERTLLQVAEGELTSHAQIKERFWEWLKCDRVERLTKNSVSAATLDEALDQWGAATYLELDVLEMNNTTIEDEHAKSEQYAIDNLPAPSKLCARIPRANFTTEESRRALVALGDLGDLDLPMGSGPAPPQSPMEAEPSSASAMATQVSDPDVEMDGTATVQTETTPAVTEEMS